jgi:N-methylhydantoinase A
MLAEAGVGASRIVRKADMRYVGQGFEVEVELPLEALETASASAIERAFHDTYAKLFGRRLDNLPVEALSWRLSATASVPNVALNFAAPPQHEPARKAWRNAFFPGHGFVPCDVYSRYALTAGTRLRGPAIIEERESTVVVGFDADIVIDEHMNLIVELDPARDEPCDAPMRNRAAEQA